MSSLGWGATRSPKWDRFWSHVFFCYNKKGYRFLGPFLVPHSGTFAVTSAELLLSCARTFLKDAHQRARHRATCIVAAQAFSNRSPPSPATNGLCAATAGLGSQGKTRATVRAGHCGPTRMKAPNLVPYSVHPPTKRCVQTPGIASLQSPT